MMSLAGERDSDYMGMTRSLVIMVGFLLCLVGAGGLVMDDMAYREVSEGPRASPAVVRAATGVDRKVVLPAAVSGAILALGVGVTLAAARRP